MATADEILSQLATEEDKVLVINNDLRTITIPQTVKMLGVESDEEVLRLHFRMPKVYGETDLSEFVIRINYINAKGSGDIYTVSDASVIDDAITFSWLISRNATIYKGSVRFIVCLKLYDDAGVLIKEYNTTVASLPVLEGLEIDNVIIDQNSTIIEDILLRLNELENSDIDVPGAKVGQTIKVSEVDENGKPIAWEASDFPEQVQSDYNQNDETAADYVKNRTHYDSRETVNIEYAFDGNIEGKEYIDAPPNEYFIKISDNVPILENLIGGSVVLNINNQMTEYAVLSDNIAFIDELNYYVFDPDDREPLFFVIIDYTKLENGVNSNGIWFYYYHNDENFFYTSLLKYTKETGELKQIDDKYLSEQLQLISKQYFAKTLVMTGTTKFSGQGAASLANAQENPHLEIGKTYAIYVDDEFVFSAKCEIGKMYDWQTSDNYRVLKLENDRICELISNNSISCITNSRLMWSEQGLKLEIYEVGTIPSEYLGKNALPTVSEADEGKILRVSSTGEWIADTIPNASGVSF